MSVATMKPAMYDTAYQRIATSKPPIEKLMISGEMFGKIIIYKSS